MKIKLNVIEELLKAIEIVHGKAYRLFLEQLIAENNKRLVESALDYQI